MREVEEIPNSVTSHKGFNIGKVKASFSTLKDYGGFYGSQLCPKDTVKELEQLVSTADQYLDAWSKFDEEIRKSKLRPDWAKEYVLGRKELLDRKDGTFAWVDPGQTEVPFPISTSIQRSKRDEFVVLKQSLDKSEYVTKDQEGFWRKEVSERASKVREDFSRLAHERSLA